MTLWTVAHQAPLSMRLTRQEYQSGLPCLPLGNLPDPGIEPASPVSFALWMGSLATEPSRKPQAQYIICLNASILYLWTLTTLMQGLVQETYTMLIMRDWSKLELIGILNLMCFNNGLIFYTELSELHATFQGGLNYFTTNAHSWQKRI